MSINRDLNVNSSYNVSMECKVNYNFEAGDATYVLYYNILCHLYLNMIYMKPI